MANRLCIGRSDSHCSLCHLQYPPLLSLGTLGPWRLETEDFSTCTCLSCPHCYRNTVHLATESSSVFVIGLGAYQSSLKRLCTYALEQASRGISQRLHVCICQGTPIVRWRPAGQSSFQPQGHCPHSGLVCSTGARPQKILTHNKECDPPSHRYTSLLYSTVHCPWLRSSPIGSIRTGRKSPAAYVSLRSRSLATACQAWL